MKKSSLLLTAPVLLVVWLMLSNTAQADHSCTDCHSSNTPSNSDLNKPLSPLCADCHAERIAAGEHLVDIPVITSKDPLPLNKGVMTCVTCHDPHQPVAALRMVDPELCEQCHPK